MTSQTPADPPPPARTPRAPMSRRALLAGSLAGAGLIGGGALGWSLGSVRAHPAPTATPEPEASPTPMRGYRSTPVSAPAVTAWNVAPTAPGLLFVTQQTRTFGGKGFRATILDDEGEPVWIEPTGANVTDLRVQRLHGRPVLTYWSGESMSGHGRGVGHILDTSYRPIATVHARGDMDADLHEVNLTDRGTALITAYTPVAADLSALGGPRDGYVYDCHAQEIDVDSDRLLFDWHALEHVPITDTYLGLSDHDGQDGTTRERAFDPFHINAVDDVGDTLLVSLRHTHTVYAIDRSSGAVRWRLGGRHSDFSIPGDARFAWQHHCRHHDDGTITIFDNHLDRGTDGFSRGLRLRLDEHARTVRVVAQQHFNRHLGTAMGSAQALPDGHTLVGWGTAPFVTEFDEDDRPIHELALAGMSYRAFRMPWHAQPHTAPAIAVEAVPGSLEVRLSWNGATEITAWRVRTGPDPAALTAVATVPRSGFETLARTARAPFAAADALDAHGDVQGTTPTVRAGVSPTP